MGIFGSVLEMESIHLMNGKGKRTFQYHKQPKNTRYIGRNEDLIIIYPGWIFYRNTCYTYQNSIPL